MVTSAQRCDGIAPFHVMELLAKARAMEADGRSIVHMEVGEPDFDTPAPIAAAGKAAIDAGQMHYTPALGLPALREQLAGWYADRYALAIDARRIALTPGSSGALQLIMAALINPGDRVLMSDPGYPCNRHFVRLFGGEAISVATGPETNYQLSAALLQPFNDCPPRAVMVASPSNPTGTVLSAAALADIHAWCRAHGATLIVDEIYHGLTYDGSEPASAASLGEDVIIVNSFSKYFGMTGWRLGWCVLPEVLVEVVDRIAQNIFLAPSTLAQHAALRAFEPETQAILQSRREAFQRRRDFLLPELRALGFRITVAPQGAFYLYADCSRFTHDSYQFCRQLLDEHGVAITPGKDFGDHQQHRHVRFAYTTAMDKLADGVERLRQAVRRL